MAFTEHRTPGHFFSWLVGPAEERKAQQALKAEKRRKRLKENLKVARDLSASGYFDELPPEGYYYRHYYF
ncbi:hypothetical protein [Ruegeria sp. HKCCD7255]|uniref:hypothetical protein n=1 Tax=Ruegeria sp. HKCCD7255 TaxID=2683004 RepID=UPI001488F375|nr:hypothetical protein [Ruegeria sp. HKCCD7255]